MGTIWLPKWVAIFSFTKSVTRNYPYPEWLGYGSSSPISEPNPNPNRNPLGLGADRPKLEPIRPIAIPTSEGGLAGELVSLEGSKSYL